MTKPRWCLGMAGTRRHTFGNLVGHVKGVSDMSSLAAWTNEQFDPRLSWPDVEWVKKQWGGKLVLKGIMDVEDAKLAAASGADAIVVSNHGGRQLDGAPSSIEALPAIVEAVGAQTEVWMDGGIRSGQDVLKAWALGARGTLIGRAMVYGLGAMGEAGVTKALQILHKELDVTMAFCGHTQLTQRRPLDPAAGHLPGLISRKKSAASGLPTHCGGGPALSACYGSNIAKRLLCLIPANLASMATRHPHAGRPSILSSMLEVRAFFEMASLPYSLPMLMQAPRGDGHPVLLLPGFMGSEGSLIALELFLRNRGYDVQTWGLGRNVGFRPGHASAIEQKIRYLHHETGRKVSLVGWSLGGVFALYGAHQASECVRNVITLGSPVIVDASGSAVPLAAEGAVPADRAPDGLGRAFDAAAGEDAARAQAAAGAGELPVFTERRRRAAARGHAGRRPRAAREHPRLGQPRGPGLQPAGAADRGRPPRAARGAVAALPAFGRAGVVHRALTHEAVPI